MKIALFVLLSLLISVVSAPAGTLCFDKENFYGIEIPEGFGADLQQAQKKKKCLLLYPLGSSLSHSPHTLTISLEPLKKDLTLKYFIDKNLVAFIGKNKKNRVEIESSTTTAQGLEFEFRRIFNNSPESAFQGQAYHLAQNQVLVVSSSIQNEDDIPLYETVYKSLVSQIKKIDIKNIFPYLKSQVDKDSSSPTAQNFDLRFINSIRGPYLAALKSCPQISSQSVAIVRLSQSGKIQNWFDEKDPEKLSCLGQKMIGIQGIKAPFEPFHVILRSSAF